MAPINNLSVLAFASAALAIPFNHGHGHDKYHNRPSGFSVYPYPSANGTANAYGTGLATGTSAPIAPVSESTVVSDVETTTAVATTYLNSASSSCTSDVTVTTTAKVTVTVNPDETSSTEAAESSSSEAAPVESSAPAYSEAPTSSSTKAEAAAQETSSAPAAYSSAAPTEASSTAKSFSAPAPTFSRYAAKKQVDVDVNIGGSQSSSSSAPSSTGAASYGSSSSSGKGKRGLAYNDAKMTDCLVESPAISWAYNWGSSPSGLKDSVTFIPTLWGPKSEFTDDWEDNAKEAIDNGSTHLFSFNEPDLGEQANLTPDEAADAWRTYMEPFSGKAKLCAPSVTNGGGDMGLNWLSSFLKSCSDCTIDCLNIHWYDSASNVEYFKKHVNDAIDLGENKKEVFLSEFAAEGSDDDISKFLTTVMPWMDEKEKVGGYAYFMASEGKLVSGSEQSTIGKTYAS